VPARTVGRIQTRAAFGQLQRSRSRASCGPVRATFVPAPTGTGGIFPQVGFAIGKSCGNAVLRNALRRRLRESARAVAAGLPRGMYLLRLEPAAARSDRAELSAQVKEALQRAGQRGQAQP
jgi:ribonuclease P protein component